MPAYALVVWICGVLGLVTGAYFLGLYRGEKGRREDMALMVGMMAPRPGMAKVTQPETAESAAIAELERQERAELKTYIESELERAGRSASAKDIAKEVDLLYAGGNPSHVSA